MASSREDVADSTSERRPLQFSLRTALLFTAVLALLFGLVAWRGLLGGLIFILLLGVGLIVAGARRRGPASIFFGIILIIFALWGGASVCWVGHQTFVVPFEVIDAKSGDPISDASVRLSDNVAFATAAAETNSQGIAQVSTTFMAYGTDSFFTHNGVVRLTDHELHVSADGYREIRRNLAEHVGTASWDLNAPESALVTVALEADKSAMDR